MNTNVVDNGSTIFTAGRHYLNFRFILLLVALAYIGTYFAIPATPGNAPYDHPLGWWGWFDQGQYLLSANALSHSDFTPEKHFYPPLYPALGALFLHWSSGHMFFVLNLFSLLWFAFVFVRVSDCYVPRWGGVALLFCTTIFNDTLFENFVIPWTSTLSAALLASGIMGFVWLYEVKVGTSPRLKGIHVLFVALCLGMIAPTRPVDAVVGGVIGLGLFMDYLRTRQIAPEKIPQLRFFVFLVVSGAAIGLLFFFSFNVAVFGTLLGGYAQTASSNGFFIFDLPEKFVSLWLDGFTLYGEPNAGLTERYPWLFLSCAGLVWALLRGDALLRTVALAICAQFVLYLPYGDLLPTGLWRFLNIHYFKWMFPFLALFACLLLIQVLSTWRQKKGRLLPTTLLVVVPLLLLSLHFVVDVTPVSTLSMSKSPKIRFDLPKQQIDFFDLKGISGGFTEIYFGAHRLLLDARELQLVRDYRVLPRSSGIRILFIRPVIANSVEFYPDPKLSRLRTPLTAQTGTYRIALGAPRPFRKPAQQKEVLSDYHIGDLVEFSNQGVGMIYVTSGWSSPEGAGRWSVNDGAGIQLRAVDYTNQALVLELFLHAFVSKAHPCQRFGITVNDVEIEQQSLCVSEGGGNLTLHKFKLAKDLLRTNGQVDIYFTTPDSNSPKSLGMSSDDRKLGVWVKSMRLTTSE